MSPERSKKPGGWALLQYHHQNKPGRARYFIMRPGWVSTRELLAGAEQEEEAIIPSKPTWALKSNEYLVKASCKNVRHFYTMKPRHPKFTDITPTNLIADSGTQTRSSTSKNKTVSLINNTQSNMLNMVLFCRVIR